MKTYRLKATFEGVNNLLVRNYGKIIHQSKIDSKLIVFDSDRTIEELSALRGVSEVIEYEEGIKRNKQKLQELEDLIDNTINW